MAKGTKTGGRRKGTPNKATGEAREVFRVILEKLAPNVQTWIESAAREDPAKGADLLLKLAEHFVPKLSRTEVTGPDGGQLVVEVRKYAELPPAADGEPTGGQDA